MQHIECYTGRLRQGHVIISFLPFTFFSTSFSHVVGQGHLAGQSKSFVGVIFPSLMEGQFLIKKVNQPLPKYVTVYIINFMRAMLCYVITTFKAYYFPYKLPGLLQFSFRWLVFTQSLKLSFDLKLY